MPFRLTLPAMALISALATIALPGHASEAAVSGPVAGTKVTEPYVRMMAREAYFWGYLPEPGLIGRIVPAAPGFFRYRQFDWPAIIYICCSKCLQLVDRTLGTCRG